MGQFITSTLPAGSASVIAPLIPGIPVFGLGRRKIFTTSGSFVSDGTPVRVYVLGAAGGPGSQSCGAGGGLAVSDFPTPSGTYAVVVGAGGAAAATGGSSSFGAAGLSATGGSGGGSTTSASASGGVGNGGNVINVTGETSGSGGRAGLYGPARSGAPNLPYGIAAMGTYNSGNGVVIVEY